MAHRKVRSFVMDDREIWNSPEWAERRTEYSLYKRWYDGDFLDQPVQRRDRDTGERILKFPLDMNMVKLACDLHRDYSRGIVPPDDMLPVKTHIISNGDERLRRLEEVINNSVWIPSHGGPLQQEAMLHMNIYGDTFFQVTYEPWNTDLPYRVAVRHIFNPGYVFPVHNDRDRWTLDECYIGYEISPEAAYTNYGIKYDGYGNVLYLEHWTKTTWEVRVDGRVPTMEWNGFKWKLRGENTWGFVPVFHVPHERTTDIMGVSQTDGITELTKQINSRAAAISDIVQSTRAGLLWGHDIDTSSMRIVPIRIEGRTIALYLDAGKTRAVSSATPPSLEAMPVPDLPDALVAYPRELMDYWMMLARISPASFGLDDSQSGRITGPAIQSRMYTSSAHSVTERINFNAAKCNIDRAIIRVLYYQRSDLAALGVDAPDVREEDRHVSITQLWPPQLPLDRSDIHRERLERLQQGGMSIEAYLEQYGIDDISGERERILAWQRDYSEAQNARNESGAEAQDGPQQRDTK